MVAVRGKGRFDQDRLLVVTPGAGATIECTNAAAVDKDTVLSLTTLWHTKEGNALAVVLAT